MYFRVKRDSILVLRRYLESMHQASMKYKLGKIERVPLDTLSFAYYNKYIRMNLLLKHASATETNHDAWNYVGWQNSFVDFDKFSHDSKDDVASLKGLVTYLFETILGRDAKEDEQQFFKSHIIESRDGKEGIRKDELSGIDVSESGWDSEMICYPFVFKYNGVKFMLYNGNGYGRTGFGYAVWRD